MLYKNGTAAPDYFFFLYSAAFVAASLLGCLAMISCLMAEYLASGRMLLLTSQALLP